MVNTTKSNLINGYRSEIEKLIMLVNFSYVRSGDDNCIGEGRGVTVSDDCMFKKDIIRILFWVTGVRSN